MGRPKRIRPSGWASLLVLLGCLGSQTLACSDDDDLSRAAGDACNATGTFRCSTDGDGKKTGELLICRGGKLELALECRDVDGCFTEASNSVGRCFHGDGTGQRCEAPKEAGGMTVCCTFQEPSLGC